MTAMSSCGTCIALDVKSYVASGRLHATAFEDVASAMIKIAPLTDEHGAAILDKDGAAVTSESQLEMHMKKAAKEHKALLAKLRNSRKADKIKEQNEVHFQRSVPRTVRTLKQLGTQGRLSQIPAERPEQKKTSSKKKKTARTEKKKDPRMTQPVPRAAGLTPTTPMRTAMVTMQTSAFGRS